MIINKVTSKEEAEKAMIAVGQEIIRRAKDITNDIDRVTSIKIDAEIEPFPEGYISVNINKKCIAEFNEKEKRK